MSAVASELNLPLRLVWPPSIELPIKGCNIVGLGDLVLPGLLICLCHRLDQRYCPSRKYYICGLIAYSVSLITCVLMLNVLQQPQPALMYIVPFVSTAVVYNAYIHKQLSLVWRGGSSQILYQKVGFDSKDVQLQSEEQGFVNNQHQL